MPLLSASRMPSSMAGMYSLGNHAADDLVDKLIALARFARRELDHAVAVLAVAAGLAHVAASALTGALMVSL